MFYIFDRRFQTLVKSLVWVPVLWKVADRVSFHRSRVDVCVLVFWLESSREALCSETDRVWRASADCVGLITVLMVLSGQEMLHLPPDCSIKVAVGWRSRFGGFYLICLHLHRSVIMGGFVYSESLLSWRTKAFVIPLTSVTCNKSLLIHS